MFFKKQKPDQAAARPRRSVVQQRRDGLPGSQSEMPRNQVYSYRASRSQRQETLGRVSPEQSQQNDVWKERFRWLKSTPRIIAVLVILLLACMSMRLEPRATVVPMDDAKGQVFLRSLQTYETAAQRTFSASWLNGNKLTVNTAQVSQDIKKQFPELKTVTISLPLVGNRPVVYVQPSTPALILTARNGTMVIVDNDGKALIADNQAANHRELKLPVITDDSGLVIAPGAIALPHESVRFITEIVGQLNAKQIPVESLTLPAGASELHVRQAGKSYYVKFNLHGNAREEAGSFLAVKRTLESSNKLPRDYIDVRVPGRAYYK